MVRTERDRSYSKSRVRRDAVGFQGPPRQDSRNPAVCDAVHSPLRGGAFPISSSSATSHLHQYSTCFRNYAASGRKPRHCPYIAHSAPARSIITTHAPDPENPASPPSPPARSFNPRSWRLFSIWKRRRTRWGHSQCRRFQPHT